MRRDSRLNRRRILRLYRKGVDGPEIARRLRLHPNTVDRHLRLAGIPRVLEAQRYAPIWQGRMRRAPYWQLRTKRGSAEVVCGRKFCSLCGRWRHLCDFPTHGGRMTARCLGCGAAANRYYTAHITAEQRALRLEYTRIWKEGKRREAGRTVRTARQAGRRPGNAIDTAGGAGILLPTRPLLILLEQRDESDLELARRSGVSARRLYGLRVGESKHVRVDVADKLAVALGIPSAIVWGDEWWVR